jgi:hypothetical protein
VEIQEGDKREAILSSRMVASLCESGSMRSFLDTETNRERGRRGGHQNPKLGSLDKVQSWPKFGRPREGRDSEIGPCLAWV